MAITRAHVHEIRFAAQEEVMYGTDPGAAAGGDMFKTLADAASFKWNKARMDRDQEARGASYSVTTVITGRENTEWSIPCDLIPSGAALPAATPPDVDSFLKALFGTKHTGTAHTSCVAGSIGTNIKLAVGGVAASGVQAGDMIAIEYTSGVYEVRYVVALVGGGTPDDITIDRACTSDPGAGAIVKMGTTYHFSASTAVTSLTLKEWIKATMRKRKITGCICNKGELSIDFGSDVPLGSLTFSGVGKGEDTLADVEPTPVTAGSPLVPASSLCWIGSSKFTLAGSQSLTVDNGLIACENEATSLEPTRPKRTANNANYKVDQSLSLYFTTGDQDSVAQLDNAKALTALDVLVQLGGTPGTIVAWRTPAFKPDPDVTKLDGEIGITFGGGRCYGVNGDDEVALAFL